ncbi:hypothetical protein FA15DRAFT_605555 [Coprinopsis marcescibilis]|uniref:Uncharacterized protein n=1 Tax=Coprinopsis marcescibilis TaxID=230819 RepID=A0A5C3KAU5_COPMA|nr:hypothetical protein FA15DRAFT_605555 [Coprinopsis marcescibilis]
MSRYISLLQLLLLNLLTINPSTQGTLLSFEGAAYFSPNCSRPVTLPSKVDLTTGQNPFQVRTDWLDLRKPMWWTEVYGWMSFMPMDRQFNTYPFSLADCISFPTYDPANQLYSYSSDMVDMWNGLDQGISDITRVLRTQYHILAVPPYPVRGWGYHKKFKSWDKARSIA